MRSKRENNGDIDTKRALRAKNHYDSSKPKQSYQKSPHPKPPLPQTPASTEQAEKQEEVAEEVKSQTFGRFILWKHLFEFGIYLITMLLTGFISIKLLVSKSKQ